MDSSKAGMTVEGTDAGTISSRAQNGSMKILDDLMANINTDTGVKTVRQGLINAATLTRNFDLAATLPRDALRQEHSSVDDIGLLFSKSALELARMAYSRSILEAAIGVAAINSLIIIDEINAELE